MGNDIEEAAVMNFWQRMKDSLTRWMYGRYGADQLSRVILYASLFLLFISFFTGLLLPFYLSIAGYGWMIFRMFSRNIQPRYAENQKFIQKWGPVSRRLHNAVLRFQDRKTHRYFKCPNCHKRLRVPKGCGKITITCPHCRTQFVRKS